MKLIIDNANIDEIRSMYEYFPMDGVTCNPTILAKEKRPPYEVLKEIRDFIEEGELHVQVISDRADPMVEEAYKIRKELGDDTYINSDDERRAEGNPYSGGGRHSCDCDGDLYTDAGISCGKGGRSLCSSLYQPHR